MLLTFALIALFAVTWFWSIGVVVDSALRGWNAFFALRERATMANDCVAPARMVEEIAVNRLPDIRTAHSGRYSTAGQASRAKRHRLSVAA